jgi:hypothetical protein
MKKLLVLISSAFAAMVGSANADVSVSGSAGLGAVSGNGSATNIYSGGAVSFALSSDLGNGVVVSTSAGITLDTNDATTASGGATSATGLSNVAFATGGSTITVGRAIGLAGAGTGDVGGAAGDLVDEGGYTGTARAALSDDEGYGVSLSTAVGGATVTVAHILDLTPAGTEYNNASTTETDTASGLAVSIPVGDITLSLGFASLDATSETNTGGSVAYVMGGNTIELGYQHVQTASGTDNETDTSARLTTSLGSAAVKVGYASGKVGSSKTTATEIGVSQSIGTGASLFLDIQNLSGAGTSGTNMAVGTTFSF